MPLAPRLLFAFIAAFALISAAAHAQPVNGGNTLVAVPPPGPPPVARQNWNAIMPYGDVEATLLASGQFSYLLNALKATKLDKTLKKKNRKTKKVDPFTLFAPTDTAFSKLPPAELQALFADADRLKALLSYHIAPAAVTSAEIRTAGGQATAAGAPLRFEANDRRMAVNQAIVLQADLAAENGSIVVIDKVLTPPESLPPSGSAG
jgi:uncharacterized surface protein with fasciclin (FAS1) repeats